MRHQVAANRCDSSHVLPAMDLNWLKQQARRAYWAVETGDVSDLGEFIAPQWRNREAEAEPPAAKGVGPAAFAATIAWLRGACTELQFVEKHRRRRHRDVARGDERPAHRRTSCCRTVTDSRWCHRPVHGSPWNRSTSIVSTTKAEPSSTSPARRSRHDGATRPVPAEAVH